MKNVYHCTPNEIDQISESTLQLHFEIYIEEQRKKFLEQKRAKQWTTTI